jgi:hypothetical protein
VAETVVQTEEGLDPSTNRPGWLDAYEKRDAGKATSTGQSDTEAPPAEPTVAESPSEPQAPSWREIQLGDDVPNDFFKGKKVGDVFDSYGHAVKAKQEAERERNELRRRIEAIEREREADAAARRALQEQQRVPAPSPESELEKVFFENPTKAAEIIEERATQKALQRFQEAEAQRQAVAYRDTAFSSGQRAVEAVQQMYDVDRTQAELMVMQGFTRLADTGDPNAWVNHESYVGAVRELYGDPQPIAAPASPNVPPQPELSDPPGVKRAAPAPRTASQPSPLSREEEETRRALWASMGLDPQAGVERARQRRR